MNRQEIRDETRFITKTNTSTYSDADFNTGLELVRKRIVMKIIRVITDWNFQGEIANYSLVSTTGLVEGDVGYKGEYPFPDDLIKITRIDLSYDGSAYNKAKLYFMNDLDSSEETDAEINSIASASAPAVKIYRDSFFVRPLPSTTISSGLQVKYQMLIEDLAEDTSSPSEISELFHEIYVHAMAVRFGNRHTNKMKNEWRIAYRELENELLKFYTERFARNMQLKPITENFS